MICLVLFMQLEQILIVLQLKIFLIFVVFWEVLVYYGKESMSDIGAYISWCLHVFSFVSCGCFIM